MQRHSLFFKSFTEAEQAESFVVDELVGVVDAYQTNDRQTGKIELRVYTDIQLTPYLQSTLLHNTTPSSYTVNQEE